MKDIDYDNAKVIRLYKKEGREKILAWAFTRPYGWDKEGTYRTWKWCHNHVISFVPDKFVKSHTEYCQSIGKKGVVEVEYFEQPKRKFRRLFRWNRRTA